MLRSIRQLGVAVGIVASLTTASLVGPGAASDANAATIPSTWPAICGSNIAPAGTALVAGAANCRYLTSDGLTRRYVVSVPAAAANDDVPVVFMFHGSGGTGEKFYDTSGWKELGANEGFISVFPTGRTYKLTDGKTQTKWNDFTLTCDVLPRPANWPAASAYPADDDSFVDAMLADLDTSSNVDLDRVYASGFSNGSAFAQRLSVTRADTFAAVGSWAGTIGAQCATPNGDPATPIVAPYAQVPPATAPPVAIGLGNRDPKFVDGINAYLVANGQPTITKIPLDQASIERYLGGMLARQGAAHGLALVSGTPIGVNDWAGVAWLASWKPPVYTTLQWPTPVAGNADGNSFTFMLLDGVTHRYPHATPGDATSIRVSGSVNAAALFWQFFERNVGT